MDIQTCVLIHQSKQIQDITEKEIHQRLIDTVKHFTATK